MTGIRADLEFSSLHEGLHNSIDRFQSRLIAVGEAIFETFVLYADLLPVEEVPAPALTVFPGDYHIGADADLKQQQQQQQ